jgi:hypothetical protein
MKVAYRALGNLNRVRMKNFCLVCTVFLLLPIAGRCQFWLNTGDVYTYEFTNFTAAGTTTASPGAILQLGMSGADGNEGFLLEIFENNTSEPPLLRFPDIRFLPNPIVLGNAWQDRQGVVRFTITSGSVSLDILIGSIVYPNGQMYAEIFDFGDADLDGVMDDKDQCPNTPRGQIVDEHGCTTQRVTTIVAEVGAPGFGWAARTDQFTVVSWTQTNGYRDVEISALVHSLALGDRGTAYLTKRVGPGTTLADQVAAASFTFPNDERGMVLLSGLTLGPGTYYLMVTGGTNLWASWFGSRGSNVISDVGVTHNGNLYVYEPAEYPPASTGRPHPDIFQIFAVAGTRMPPNRPPLANAGTDQPIECSGTATSVLLDGRESRDPDGDALTYRWWEGATQLGIGSTLNVHLTTGSHNIRLVVTDTSGSSAEDSVLVDIQDITAPRIDASASPAVLWPPNGKMVPVVIEARVLDACDATASARIVAVESDQPNDWEITGALTLSLRARKGSRYRVTVEASDASGNTARTTVSVYVPGRGNQPASSRLP